MADPTGAVAYSSSSGAGKTQAVNHPWLNKEQPQKDDEKHPNSIWVQAGAVKV